MEECDETDGQTALLTASGRMTAVSPDDSKCRTESRIAATGGDAIKCLQNRARAHNISGGHIRGTPRGACRAPPATPPPPKRSHTNTPSPRRLCHVACVREGERGTCKWSLWQRAHDTPSVGENNLHLSAFCNYYNSNQELSKFFFLSLFFPFFFCIHSWSFEKKKTCTCTLVHTQRTVIAMPSNPIFMIYFSSFYNMQLGSLKDIFDIYSSRVCARAHACVHVRSVAPLLIDSLNICFLPLPRQNTSSSLKDTPHSLCTMKIRFSCCSFKLLYGMRFDAYEILSFFSSVLSFFQNTKKKVSLR